MQEFEAEESNGLHWKRYLISVVIFILISMVTFYFLSEFFASPERFFVFTAFNYPWIFALVAALLAYHFLDGLRFYFILKTLNQKVRFLDIFKLVFINLFVSNITPFATGGGFAQVYFLKQKGISLGSATAATTIRTLLATSLIFASAPLILISKGNLGSIIPGNSILVYAAVFLSLYLLFFYVVIFKSKFLKKIIYGFFYFLNQHSIISREKFRKSVLYVFKHIDLFRKELIYFFKNDWRFVFMAVLFTALFLLSEFSFSVILLRGMGYRIPVIDIIFLQILVVFVMYFAPTPGASGVAEGGYAVLFAGFVAGKDIFPLIFSWRLFTKYIGITLGMVIFFSTVFKRIHSSLTAESE